MNKFSRNEWSGIAIGFALGFVVCLIGIGFWPTGEKHDYQHHYSPNGLGTYHEVTKSWGEWLTIIWDRTSEDPVAFFTFVLGISTILLWVTTACIARDTRNSAKNSIDMERPYITGGGDFENKTGLELFRLDVENHGKTAAFMTGYDLQFAKLAELQKDPTVRDVRKNHFRHMDGISPQGARKIIRTQILKPPDDDVVFGAVWYEDIFGKPHYSRFLLRIAHWRDIRGEGLTRLDVEGVSSDYWYWDYKNKEQL